MEERAGVLRRLAGRVGNHSPDSKTSYESRAAKQDRNATIIREVLAKKGT
jgi:hypothetical protein